MWWKTAVIDGEWTMLYDKWLVVSVKALFFTVCFLSILFVLFDEFFGGRFR